MCNTRVGCVYKGGLCNTRVGLCSTRVFCVVHTHTHTHTTTFMHETTFTQPPPRNPLGTPTHLPHAGLHHHMLMKAPHRRQWWGICTTYCNITDTHISRGGVWEPHRYTRTTKHLLHGGGGVWVGCMGVVGKQGDTGMSGWVGRNCIALYCIALYCTVPE